MRTSCLIVVAVAVMALPVASLGQPPQGNYGPGVHPGVPPGLANGMPTPPPQKKPSFSQRAKSAFTHNPVTSAWSSWRGRKEQPPRSPYAHSIAHSGRHDAIALSAGAPTGSPDLFIAAAKLSERNGQIEKARQQFHQGLTMAPRHVQGLIEFGRLEDRQGRLPEAEKLYRAAVGVNPHNPTALNDLALCVARQGRLDESAQLLQQAIDMQPDKALYRNNMATVLVEQRRDQEALAHLTAVHGPSAANYNLGQLLSKRGRSQDAAQYFAAAVEIDPQMTQAHEALAALEGSGGGPPRMAATPVQNTPPVAVPQQRPVGQPVYGPQMGPALGNPAYPPATAWVPQRQTMRPLPPVGGARGPYGR